MGVSISIKGYAGKESPEFQKHFKAVQFCLENDLSFPKETSDFFKGRFEGGNLEHYDPKWIVDYIKNGIEIEIPMQKDYNMQVFTIDVTKIPPEVDTIIVKMDS